MKDFCAPSDSKYKIHQNCFTGFSAIFNHFILMRSVKIDEIPCKQCKYNTGTEFSLITVLPISFCPAMCGKVKLYCNLKN